jgi:hypothetical protein
MLACRFVAIADGLWAGVEPSMMTPAVLGKYT